MLYTPKNKALLNGRKPPVISIDYMVNGDFSNGNASWNGLNGGPAIVSGGQAVLTSAPQFTIFSQNLRYNLLSGKYYELKYDCTITAGTVTPRLFDSFTNPGFTVRSTTGTYTERVLVITNIVSKLDFVISSVAAFSGTFDNISLKGPYLAATNGGA